MRRERIRQILVEANAHPDQLSPEEIAERVSHIEEVL